MDLTVTGCVPRVVLPAPPSTHSLKSTVTEDLTLKLIPSPIVAKSAVGVHLILGAPSMDDKALF